MAEVINLSDGRKEIVDSLSDFLELAGDLMGDEARDWFETYLKENYLPEQEIGRMEDECAKEIERVEEHYKDILRELHDLSKELTDLICSERLNRMKISHVAGQIGNLTGRNL